MDFWQWPEQRWPEGGKAGCCNGTSGRVLRICDAEDMKEVMAEFVRAFKQGAIYPEQKRLVLKEYPAEAAEALQHAGYMREMKDYVIYK